MFRAFGVFLEGLVIAASGEVGRGLSDMRRGVELLREQNVLWFDGLLKMALAEAEAQGEIPVALSASSTKRWRRAIAPVIARSRGSCIGCKAKSCSNKTPPIPRPRKKLS